MKFVSESIIEKIAEQIGSSEDNFNQVFEEFSHAQPAVLAFLFSDALLLLTQEEKEFLLFLTLVICKSSKEANSGLSKINQSQLGEAEENNWEKLNNEISKKFRERLDVFFENYEQEDLLAFVEDSLNFEEEDEDDSMVITKEGREPIFIALKTVIDCLSAQNE